MVCTRPAVSAWMRASSAIRSSSSPVWMSRRAASALRSRAARFSIRAMPPSSARTTQAKAVSASPTLITVPPTTMNVSVMATL
jgi:hypothetical protein